MIKADGSTVKYAYYKAGINPGPQAAMLYDYLYNTKQTTQKEGKEVWGFGKEVDGEYVPFTSSGYVARDEEGKLIATGFAMMFGFHIIVNINIF